MNKNIKYVLSLASILTLVSCEQTSSSAISSIDSSTSSISSIESTFSSQSSISSQSSESSQESVSSSQSCTSSSEIVDTTSISLSDAISLLETAKQQEVLLSNGVNKTTVTKAGDILDNDVEQLTIYSDNSSSSIGKVVETDKGSITKTDSYKTIKTTTTDRIEVDSVINDYPMFVSIKDYENDVFAKNSFQDRVLKQYIVSSATEAEEGGLTDSTLYVLASDVTSYESGLVASDLQTFLYTNFVANVYSSATKLNITKNTNETTTYSINDSYSYDGDMNDVITENYSVSFTMDKDNTKLISTSYEVNINDVSKSDSTDAYVTGSTVDASINYGTREENINLLNPDDYFLATLNDIELLGSLGSGREVVQPSEVPSNATYLFANASDYTPAKACNLSLTPVSSSNTAVVECSGGYLKVIGEGTTTLSFTYFGNEDGIYKQRTFEKEITVVQAKPESVYIYSPTPDIEDNCIMQGKTYTYKSYVSPSKANQQITVSSSDTNIIEVSVDIDNNVVVKGVNPGTATITVASKIDSNVKYEKTLTVQSNNIDFANYITTKTYKSSDINYYYFIMTFNSDGTGVRTQYLTQNKVPTGVTYEDAFTYTINETTITFKWTTDYKDYQTGIITNNGDTISCSCDEADGYSSYTFKAQ